MSIYLEPRHYFHQENFKLANSILWVAYEVFQYSFKQVPVVTGMSRNSMWIMLVHMWVLEYMYMHDNLLKSHSFILEYNRISHSILLAWV